VIDEEEKHLKTRCMRCGREYEMLAYDTLVCSNGPDGVVICETTGCYGSTVYDMLAGDPPLQFIVCDECFAVLRPGMFVCQDRARAIGSDSETSNTSTTIEFTANACDEAGSE
jgi:hypothetical protein